MGEFFVGAFTAACICFWLFLANCGDNSAHVKDHRTEKIEERAQKAYQDWGNSVNWYKKDKHIEPWVKLSEEEKYTWRVAVDFCGHGEPNGKIGEEKR